MLSRILPRAIATISSRRATPYVRNGAAFRSQAVALARPQFAPAVSQRDFSTSFLDPSEVSSRVVEVVKAFDKVDPSKVAATSKFADDLGLDSLDAVEVVMAIEDEFAIEIPDAEADRILSVEDAVAYISAHPMAK
uniref:Acyl carrier protein n=1 Tax=Corethron hystrix TaxID=216773 RepID=A0A7S1FKS7_9STRA|mmetsp:Transcript_12414/g.27290  ORF Transcript_12414/g.27290 Transcript_12414/m.27290 type:complete len:136 (+) Transcript_12414:107-514(+)